MADGPVVTEAEVAAALRAGEPSTALTALRALAETPSADRAGYTELIDVLAALASGAVEEAYFRLSEEIEAPTDLEPEVYAAVGEALDRAGHRELAASAWASAEDHTLAERALALRKDLGLDDEALDRTLVSLTVAYYRGRVAAADGDAAAWEALARKLVTQQMPAGALEAGEKAVGLEDQRVWAWVAVGQALTLMGRLDDAVQRLEAAARAIPSRSEPLVEAGMVHLARRNTREAAVCFRRALDRNPGDGDARARLAALEATPEAVGREKAPAVKPALAKIPLAEPTVFSDWDLGRVGRVLWWAFMIGVGGLFVRWLRQGH